MNSYISYKQLVKFIGCESLTRWLFKIKDNTQAIHVDDVLFICRKLRDVLCEKVWRYNLLVWGEENLKCLLGLLKAFAINSANTFKNSSSKINPTSIKQSSSS